jgi:hypothetical protein
MARRDRLLQEAGERIEACRNEFVQNRCESPLPALAEYCRSKESCMARSAASEVNHFQVLVLTLSQAAGLLVSQAGALCVLVGLALVYILRRGEVKEVEVTKHQTPRRHRSLRKD